MVDDASGSVVEVFHAEVHPAHTVERWLGTDERERSSRLRSEIDRDRYATAHALLRVVVERWTETPPEALVFGATCRRCGGPHGQPELRSAPGAGLYLSLSRSGPEPVVAVTRLGPVGVDSGAPIADDFEGFDGVALSPREREAIDVLPAAQRARGRGILWARKEAVLKATGHGLLLSPDRVEVSPPFAAPRLVAWRAVGEGAPTVQLLDLDLPAPACGAVAVLGERSPELVVRRGDRLLGQR